METHGATDLAGVKNRGDLAVGFLIQPETDVDAVLCGGEGVEITIGNLGKPDGRLAIHKRYGGRGGKRVHALGVDEFCRYQQDKQERARVNGSHPQALAARTPHGFAALGRGCRDRHRLPPLDFKQYHQRRQGENRNEEEEVIANDGPDDSHFAPGGGKNAIFRKLMQSGND